MVSLNELTCIDTHQLGGSLMPPPRIALLKGTEREMTDDETNAFRVTVISCKRWADDFTAIWRGLLCRPLFDLASGIARRQPLSSRASGAKSRLQAFLGSLLVEASQGPALSRVIYIFSKVRELIMGRRAAPAYSNPLRFRR
jgi:hypothetical protein